MLPIRRRRELTLAALLMHFLVSVAAVITVRQPLIYGEALIQSFLFFSCEDLQEFIYLYWYLLPRIWDYIELDEIWF